MPGNQDQITFWNEKAGRDWVDLQERMDANLSGIGAAILAAAAAQPGETVLDLGCGTGATTLALADAVGGEGHVTGLDVSKPMLALAESRAKDRANICFIEADAAHHAFTEQYDLLFSRFGVMFFDDPIGAFANLHKAAKNRLAFVCWRSPRENLWASAPIAAARPFLPEMPPPDPYAPGPFAFADSQRVLSILTDVGFHNVEIDKYDAPMRMGADIDTVAAQTLRIGPLSRALGEADDAIRTNIVAAVKTTLEEFRAADGEIAPPAACWLVTATP